MSPTSTPADHDSTASHGLRRALPLAGLIVAADQLTKRWAVDRLDRAPCSVEDACIDVFWTLRFRLSFNPGAAFSSFTGGGQVLAVVAFAMSIYLTFLAARSADRWLPWLFGTVIGGALGNLWDRVARAEDGVLSGSVVDFIDFQFWPIFNVADIAVVGGVIALAARLWWLDGHSESEVDGSPGSPHASDDSETAEGSDTVDHSDTVDAPGSIGLDNDVSGSR